MHSEGVEPSSLRLRVEFSTNWVMNAFGLDSRIRTYDLVIPNHAFYQTKPYPDFWSLWWDLNSQDLSSTGFEPAAFANFATKGFGVEWGTWTLKVTEPQSAASTISANSTIYNWTRLRFRISDSGLRLRTKTSISTSMFIEFDFANFWWAVLDLNKNIRCFRPSHRPTLLTAHLVGLEGIEPSRELSRWSLSPTCLPVSSQTHFLVTRKGFEPLCIKALVSKTSMYTNSIT